MYSGENLELVNDIDADEQLKRTIKFKLQIINVKNNIGK